MRRTRTKSQTFYAISLAATSAVSTVLLLPIVGATAHDGSGPPQVYDVTQNPSAADRAQYGQDRSTHGGSAPVRAESRSKADEHGRNDAFLQGVLRGTNHRLLREGPWTRYDGTPIGLVREIAFDKPHTVPMRAWPGIQWSEEPGTDGYAPGKRELDVRRMASITLFFDDNNGLVGAYPDSGSVVVSSPNNVDHPEMAGRH
jgi:hypothetical protein